MTDNIYITALKYGRDKLPRNVQLTELKEHLKSKGFLIDRGQEYYFDFWFFTHFFNVVVYKELKNGDTIAVNNAINNFQNYQNFKGQITAESLEYLTDVEKLKQAREDAKSSKKLAIIAILISALLAIVQIVLQVWKPG